MNPHSSSSIPSTASAASIGSTLAALVGRRRPDRATRRARRRRGSSSRAPDDGPRTGAAAGRPSGTPSPARRRAPIAACRGGAPRPPGSTPPRSASSSWICVWVRVELRAPSGCRPPSGGPSTGERRAGPPSTPAPSAPVRRTVPPRRGRSAPRRTARRRRGAVRASATSPRRPVPEICGADRRRDPQRIAPGSVVGTITPRWRRSPRPASRRRPRAGAGCGTRRRRRRGWRTRRRSSRPCSSTTAARGSASTRGGPCGASP